VRRAIGERIGGTMAPMERVQANLGFELQDQIAVVNRRLEWMAASALNNGTIVVTGDGFPTTTIDFNRDTDLTVTLTSGDRWGESGVVPSESLEAWATEVLKESGVAPTDIVFTPLSWKLFRADSSVKDSIDLARAGNSAIELGLQVGAGGMYKGQWGNFRLWLYNDWYIDPADNTEKPMLADGTVLMSSAGMEGVRAFGAIMDPKFAYGAMAYAPKSWVEEDPAQRVLMMQSAPLVIPSRVNASFRAKVR